MNKLDSKTCDQLQQRLQRAETAVREAIQGSDEQNPLRAATQELVDAHRDIRELLQSAEEVSENEGAGTGDHAVVKAEIEIGREEHELKPEPKDILKAIFMWKDNPQERVSS